jgi:steroid delta-isomerase
MKPASVRQPRCDAWIGVFTRLHRDGVPSMEELEAITAPDVRFRDPFNDLRGREAIRALLRHTREQVSDVRFRVLDRAASDTRVYLKWEMTGRVRLLGDWRVSGMSELEFDADGRLLAHQDHWDASEQFFFRLPVLGWLLRRVRDAAAVVP